MRPRARELAEWAQAVHQLSQRRVAQLADNTLSGENVATALDKVVSLRGAPASITVDNGSEFVSKAMDTLFRNSLD